jgi:RND family efflux transporter MFP subunit
MIMTSTFSRRERLHLGAAMLLVATAASCVRGAAAPADTKTPAAASGPVAIDVVRVVSQPLDVQLSLPGELAAYQAVAIYPRVNGFVKTLRVDRGSHVHAGELLATLDAPEVAAQRSEAQSKLQAAEAQLLVARAKADADKSTSEKLQAAAATPGVVAGNDLVVAQKAAEASQNQVAVGQQNVEAARQALSAVRDMEGYLRITAPFDGVITERNIHPGALVGPSSGPGASTPMLRLIDNHRLRLVVAVPEAYSADIKQGASIPFSVAAYPGKSWTGTIARLADAVDVNTRTMAVELDVDNKDSQLAPGTFCQVRWPVHRSTPSLFVPSGSVASTTERTFVVRVRGGKAEWVDVKTGLTSGPLIEVFGDLHAGDEVAGRGTDEVRPGTPVSASSARRDNAVH